jgi:hypothetical protein
MESLFQHPREHESLVKMVEATAAKLQFKSWIGPGEALNFERLWQIKAAAGDRKGAVTKPVLCRAVGTYRHMVADLPVWGPASVVLKLAAGLTLDSLTLQLRAVTDRVIEQARIVPPDEAARQVLHKMNGLMSGSKLQFSDVAAPLWFRFGYFSLSKRKAQRLLAPVYAAALHTEGEETFNYLAVVPASDKSYLPLDGCISEAPALSTRAAR